MLKELPPVIPPKGVTVTDFADKCRECGKQKKGKWERGYSFSDGEYVKCTVCGEIIKCIYPMHYCPNCGAEMESE